MGRMNMLVRGFIIHEFHVLAVPLQFLPQVLESYYAQLSEFCKGPAEIKIGTGWTIVTDGINEVLMMTLDPWD